jgi:hypothetical protein
MQQPGNTDALHSLKFPAMTRLKSLVSSSIGFLSVLFFTGCDSFYFSRPQPSDRENLGQFPKSMQGLWLDVSDNEEDGGDVILTDDEQTQYRIDRQRIWIYGTDEVSLIDRVLTPELAEKESTSDRSPFPSLREERRDSSSGQIDTIDHFIIHDSMIHPLEDGKLRRGYPFRKSGDTILFTRRDTSCMELGHHLLLRKVSKNLYALNFRDGTNREAKDWWEIIIVRPEKGALNGYFPGKKMGEHPAKFLERNQNHYLDLDIRANEMEAMIRDSLFVHAMRLIAR